MRHAACLAVTFTLTGCSLHAGANTITVGKTATAGDMVFVHEVGGTKLRFRYFRPCGSDPGAESRVTSCRLTEQGFMLAAVQPMGQIVTHVGTKLSVKSDGTDEELAMNLLIPSGGTGLVSFSGEMSALSASGTNQPSQPRSVLMRAGRRATHEHPHASGHRTVGRWWSAEMAETCGWH